MGDAGTNMLTMPVNQRETTQQGVTFTWEATLFDTLARPTQVSLKSGLNSGRVEETLYKDSLEKWILGQVEKVTVPDGNVRKVMREHTFDPTTFTVRSVTKFGKLQQSLTYYADGTIKTIADGKNQTTTFSDYKRGISQRIDYPDASFESAVVNNLGKITSLTIQTSLTNEASTYTFGYDAIGRLASIAYPSPDTVAWNQTILSFGPVAGQEYDLGAGHWKQTVTTGNGIEATYLDALWRPVYVERWDSADRTGTVRVTKHQYDFAGRTTFDSYPKRVGESLTDGISHAYDALGRLTTQSTNSELGTLYENYYYLDGFKKQYVDAKGYNTYYSYQAFDQPVEEAITEIAMPEGVAVNIERDLFGKAKSITRSGDGLSLQDNRTRNRRHRAGL
jgi:hypothetical protein